MATRDAEPRWQEWLAESWSFEQRAIAAGIAAPQPVPNPADGSCLAWVSRLGQNSQVTDAPVRVHHWTAGVPVSPGPVDVATDRWPELTEAARRSKAPWISLMEEAAPGVA